MPRTHTRTTEHIIRRLRHRGNSGAQICPVEIDLIRLGQRREILSKYFTLLTRWVLRN